MELESSMEYQEMMLKYEFAKKKVETDLEILLREYAFKEGYNPVEHIKSRIKSYERIVEKLKRKDKEITVTNILSNVSDVVGMRIVCSFIKVPCPFIEYIRSSVLSSS